MDALVAFAIATIALTVIVTTMTSLSTRQAERVYRQQATEFAYSILEQYRITFPNMALTGADPSGWTWRVTEKPAEVGYRPDALMTFFDVSVTAWHIDRPDLSATLDGTIAPRSE